MAGRGLLAEQVVEVVSIAAADGLLRAAHALRPAAHAVDAQPPQGMEVSVAENAWRWPGCTSMSRKQSQTAPTQ